MSTREESWATRLHAAVDDHPGALAFDVSSYVETGRRRVRRNRAAALSAAAAALVVVGVVVALAGVGTRGAAPRPAVPVVPTTPAARLAPNGWVVVDAARDAGGIYLVRPGEEARRLEVSGPDGASEACPVWSPDGTRLLFGRVTSSPGTTPSDAELVIVPLDQDGAAGAPTVIGLDGFKVLEGFDPHPCGIWAPDGRWVAFAGSGEVWVVDTQTNTIRRLPDLRPSDLEWRPGTDELAIAGDLGPTRAADWQATPVSLYSVSTGELRQLGSIDAGAITWSPDGTTLAYTAGGGGRSPAALRNRPAPQAFARGLWLVDANGDNERLLVRDLGPANHGIGPVWSPTGDRIAYQRHVTGKWSSGERHEVVLVNVPEGTETVIEPPEAAGLVWYPFTVSWSPDGTTLLYAAWSGGDQNGVVAVPADRPTDAELLIDAIDPVPENYSHQWAPPQMWGRQPD